MFNVHRIPRGAQGGLMLLALLLLAGCPASQPKDGGNQGNQGTSGTTAGGGDEHGLPTDSYDGWTTENTPEDWWTRRDDTPWADEISMDGSKTLTEDTEFNGETLPAGTYLRWRRLKPGFEVLADALYREDRDETYQKYHAGKTHQFSQAVPNDTNTLTIGSIGKSSNLNPILTQDTASSDIAYFVFTNLVDVDAAWEAIPRLAEGFMINPTGDQYTYFIRPGCNFSNGDEITAHDVEFTYSSINDPNVQSPRKGDFEILDSVEVLDDYTVRFNLTEPSAPFKTNTTYGIIPRKVFELPENRDMNEADFNRYPIGGGPYVLDKYEGEDVHLVSNPEYFGRKAPIERIIFKKTPNSDLEQKQLQSHEIDLGYIAIPDLDPVAEQHPEIRQMRTAYGLSYSYMGFNLKSSFFKDHKVRQAIAHAVNRDNLIQQVIFGHGAICNANIPPMSPYYNKDVKGYDFNPEKAKQLLAEAGWADTNNDGIVEKDGRPFSFELITNDGNNERKKMAELIQIDLRTIGIDAKPRLIEWSSFIENFIHEHRFEAYILGWSLSTDPDDYTIFHSSQYDDGLNYGYYANPDVDRLLEQGRVTIDPAARKQIYFEIQENLAKDLPYLFLMYRKKSGGVLRRLDGLPQVEPNSTSYVVPVLDATRWFVKGYGPTDGGPGLSPDA